MSSAKTQAGEKFEQLVSLMAGLRGPGGCPWDREQTFESLKPYTLEETYEVLEAIDARNWPELAEELGDYLLQAVFYGQMAAEEGFFRIEDSLDAINEKLIRRHPHIFGDVEARTASDVKKRWDEIKAAEKQRKDGTAKLLLDSVPRSVPALVEAEKVSSRAANAGFDWKNVEQVLEKVQEELRELAAAIKNRSHPHIEGEVGDLLFTLVNVARFLQVDPEQALRKTNGKFRERFNYVERTLQSRGKELSDSGIDEMEALWQEAKRGE